MTDGFRVQVTGLREFQADLRKMDAGLSRELNKQFRAIAEKVSSKAAGRVPRLTGAAARSVKPHGTQKGASVTGGGMGVPYYPWLDFGGKVGRNKSVVRPFIREGRYVWKAASEEVKATEEAAKDAIRDAATKAGFEVVEGFFYMGGPQVKWELIGDVSKSSKAIDTAITKSGTLTSKLQGIGKGVALGAGIAAFNLLTTGIGLAISKLDEARDAYLEDAKSQDMLAAAYNRSGVARNITIKAIEAQISANQALGVSDSAQRVGINAFINLTKNATTAMALNTATMNLAAATGKTYTEAQTDIIAGLAGRGTALKKAGIEMTKDMTAMQLAAAISAKYEGAQAKLAQTQGGKLTVANEKVGEAMEKVGKVMGDIASVAIPILAEAFTRVVDFMGSAGRAIAQVTASVTRALIPVFRAVLPVAQTVFGGVAKVVGFLGDVVRNVFGFIGQVIGHAVNLIKTYFNNLTTAVGAIMSVFRIMSQFVGKVFSTITGVIRSVINGVIGVVNTAIRAINAIEVHIHVGPVDIDWNGVNIRQIPKLHAGGIVPGPMGQEVPIMALGGERFIDPHASSGDVGSRLEVHIHGNVYGGPSGIDELADLISGRLRLQGSTRH